MTRILYRARRAVTLVGAGPTDPAALAEALSLAPEVIGADGGGDVELPAGARFGAVIGDLDSVRSADRLRSGGVPVHEIAEQDSTDLEKCLYSVSAPAFIGLGFLGGRLDHGLAALHALARYPSTPVVLVGRQDLCVLCPPVLELDLPAGARVSFFPLGPARGTVSEGLRWSVAGLPFDPLTRIGTSNAATGGRMRAGFEGPGMLAILPREHLAQVFDRLRPGQD